MRHAAGLILVAVATLGMAHAQDKRWTDADLLAGYAALAADGGLDRAIRSPARVQQGAPNDDPRTRTWKVIQKLTLLRDEMTRRDGRYAYDALPAASPANDPWETAHTLRSPEEFAQKVCGAPAGRAVLVKFGNTNRTQCMLFELTGSVKAYADAAAGRSTSTRCGSACSRITCGDALPDVNGGEATLDACLAKDSTGAPVAAACARPGAWSGGRQAEVPTTAFATAGRCRRKSSAAMSSSGTSTSA